VASPAETGPKGKARVVDVKPPQERKLRMSPQTNIVTPPEVIGTYPVHQTASLFPLLESDAYQDLKKSIEQHGQQEPIVLKDGVLIDGRNRLKVLLDLGRQPVVREYDSSLAVEEYILVQNLWRRHLSDDQRTMIVTQVMLRKETEAAAARKQEARKRGGEGGRGNKKTVAVNSTQRFRERTVTEKIAATAKGTDYEARQAVAVIKHAPELVEPVKKGAMPLKEAARAATARKATTHPAPRREPSFMDAQTRICGKIHDAMKKFPTRRRDLRKAILEVLEQWEDGRPGSAE
jgi:ParB-like chromosome segregation protein Spo0J